MTSILCDQSLGGFPTWRALLLLFAIILVSAPVGKCQDTGSSDVSNSSGSVVSAAEKQRAEMLFAGIWNAIETIHAIDVRIVEVHTARQESEQVEYRYAFDKERDLLRFDRDAGDRHTQYAKSDSEVLWHSMQGGQPRGIVRHPRDYEVKVYDARPCGFLTAPFFPGQGYLLKFPDDRVREITDKRLQNPFVDWSESEKQIDFTVEYDMKQKAGHRGRTRMVLDREQGTMPTLVEQSIGLGDSAELTITSRTETRWKQIGDVWVPATCQMSALDRGESWHLTYEWLQVNEPLSEDLFTAEGFAPPDGTLVMNKKLGGQPVLEEIIGEDVQLKDAPPRSPTINMRSWIVGINLFVIAMAAAYGLVRFWRKR